MNIIFAAYFIINQGPITWALPQGMPRLPTFWFMSPLLLEDLGSQDSYQVELPDSSALLYAYGRFCRAQCNGDNEGKLCTKICTVCTEDGCETRKEVFDPANFLLSGERTGSVNLVDHSANHLHEDDVYNPAENPGLYKADFPYDPALNPGQGNQETLHTNVKDTSIYEDLYDAQDDDYNAYVAAVDANGENLAALHTNGLDSAALQQSEEDDYDQGFESTTKEPEVTTTEVPETTTPPLALKWPKIKVKERKPFSHGHRKYSSFASNKFTF